MTHKFNIIALLFIALFSIASCDSDSKSSTKLKDAETAQVVEEKATTDEIKEIAEAVEKEEASGVDSEVKEEVEAIESVEEKTVEVATAQEKVTEIVEETAAVKEETEKSTKPEVVPVEANPYVGKYDVLDDPQATGVDDGKIEVLEIFSYMCPHCFHFNNYLKEWMTTKAEDVEFVHLPVVYNKSWKAGAKAYFVAKNLGVLDEVHDPIFNAIHVDNKKLGGEKSLTDLFTKHGVEEQKFSDFYNSFSVDSQVRAANTTASKYGVKGVPAIIVNGKYRLSTEKSGGYKQMMKIVDYLVEKERQLMLVDDK